MLTIALELNLPRNDNALRISSTIKRHSNIIFQELDEYSGLFRTSELPHNH